MKDKKNVKFIRKNGRVIPIKTKDGKAPVKKSGRKPVNKKALKSDIRERKWVSDFSNRSVGRRAQKKTERKFSRLGMIAGVVAGSTRKGGFKRMAMGGIAGSVMGVLGSRISGASGRSRDAAIRKHSNKKGNKAFDAKTRRMEKKLGSSV